MQIEESSSMRLRSIDYIYVLLSCIAGVWQAWCANYGRDNLLSVILAALMSAPFALASYAHVSFHSRTSNVAERPDWKRLLVLWAGMPLSLIVGALTILAETRIMYAAGFGIDNLPFDSFRLVIGEGSACLVWATCLLIWSRQQGLHALRTRLLGVFATLFAGVLFAHGLSNLILRSFHKDIYFLLTSTVATTMSALILVYLRSEPSKVGSRDISAT